MDRVIAKCDDTENKLVVHMSDDGDMHVAIIGEDGIGLRKSVRIRTCQGGGRQRHLHSALRDVLTAIRKDDSTVYPA